MGPMTGRAAGYCASYPVPGFMNPIPGRGFMGWGGGPYYGAAMPGYGAGLYGAAYGYGAGVPYGAFPRFGRGFGRGWGRGFGRGWGRGFGRGRGRGSGFRSYGW